MVLTSGQLTQMRTSQADLMGDTCQIGTYSAGTADSHGYVPGAYTYATAIDCGLEWKGANEEHTELMNVSNADAMLRVPHTTAINIRDRVKLTKRYGTDITDLVFEVESIVRRGPTASLVMLRRVAT